MLLATAACKHILVYDSQQPSTRDVNASLHDLHDYYLRPWRACATVAHSASMMCSYGSFNGLPDCLHGDYINGLIRAKWNWSGFVVSDCESGASSTRCLCSPLSLSLFLSLSLSLPRPRTFPCIR